MSKILFSDLDGTLLKDNKTVSEKNKAAINKLIEEGNYFAICTGRPVASGRRVAKELGLNTPGCYMICFNGGVVYDCAADRVLKEYSLLLNDVYRLFEAAEKEGLHIHTYNDTDILSLKHTKELDYYRFKSNMTYKIISNLVDGIDKAPQKCLLCNLDSQEKLLKFQADNMEWTKQNMNCFFSCQEYLEYVPKGIDKGSSIEYLCDFLNIPLENSVAVGDERNDISMIQAAHVGVAMKNSHEDVFAFADYVTEHDNNHDAIAEVIEKFILN